MTPEEEEANFMQLIMRLQSTAWMMLGKVMNPMTGGIEKNLDAAKGAIDVLIMLKNKTSKNLSSTEQSFLDSTIQQLELNYIETIKKDDAKIIDSGDDEILSEEKKDTKNN